MLNRIVENTLKYIELMPKKERKKYGQFFTSIETARYMASLFVLPQKEEINLLDAGAGSGILTAAFIESIVGKGIKKVNITCYENDEKILELLNSNLNILVNESGIELNIEIKTENYITSQYLEFNEMIGADKNPIKYDVVIGNPPYMKIPKDAPEAIAMPIVCYGAPNLYFLFATMGLFNLKDEAEMVYIIPRSWTSGAYFKRFRDYLLTVGKLINIHLFTSRKNVFDKEDVLQETLIIKVKKTAIKPTFIRVTSTETSKNFADLTSLDIPYDIVVNGNEKYVYLVTDEHEVEVLKKINLFQDTLPSVGLRMKTGLTVDFRNRNILRDEKEDGAIPLFYSQHIQDGVVKFPIHKESEYVIADKKGLRQENKNYLFVKRFTAKEERRRLQCGMYLAKHYPEYDQISTQNKLNFIDGVTTELSECVLYGLYVLFNSTIYDEYYRILNGSTQVNSTEINNMPVPNLETIQRLGRRLMKTKVLTQENCDRLLEECYG